VDPLDRQAIADALLGLLRDRKAWSNASRNVISGVRKYYFWQAHARGFLDKIAELPQQPRLDAGVLPQSRTLRRRDRGLFTDLDQNLTGDAESLRQFIEVMHENRKQVIFGIATGRRIDTALALMTKRGIPRPDVLISSLGTRIHYGETLVEDDFWAGHVDHNWSPQQIRNTLASLPGIELQPKVEQTPHKISYYYDARKATSIDEINTLIRQKELTANVIFSFGQFLDILPSRASKGQALRYVAQRLEIPLERTLVAGGSGADEDMMRGNTLAVVVENRHHEELSQLIDQERIYFAEQPYAQGILEAIDHYDFFGACRVPQG